MTSTLPHTHEALPATPESGLVRFIRDHPLGAFLGWFFTIGQAIVFVPVLAPSAAGTDLPSEPFIIVSSFVGLLLPALVITRIADGPEALRSLVRRALRVEVAGRWYAVAVAVPLTTAAIVAALSGTPENLTGAVVASALVFGFVLQVVVVFLTVNWLEEIAWMGFVQARLQEGHGTLRATVVTAVLFGMGHISLAFEDGPAAAISFMAILIVVSVGFRALQGWLYNSTGRSLFLVGVLHAGANAVSSGSVLGKGVLSRLSDDPASGLVFPLLGVLGFVLLAATRGRLGSRRTTTIDRPTARDHDHGRHHEQ